MDHSKAVVLFKLIALSIINIHDSLGFILLIKVEVDVDRVENAIEKRHAVLVLQDWQDATTLDESCLVKVTEELSPTHTDFVFYKLCIV